MLVSVEEYMHLCHGKSVEQQHRYEVARFLAFHVMTLSPYIKQGRRPRSPQAYIPFPWDTAAEPYIGRVTEADVAKLYELFNDFNSRQKK